MEVREIERREGQNGETEIIYEFIAEGEIVGGASVSVWEDLDGAVVSRIDIDEGHRNRGYGTDALQWLSGEFWRIYLAPDNEDAARLYGRLGEETWEDSWSGLDAGYGVFRV